MRVGRRRDCQEVRSKGACSSYGLHGSPEAKGKGEGKLQVNVQC